MPTSSPLKVGVVGAGVGRMHLRAYQALENVEVVALCDVDETRLTQVGDLFNITYRYTDYKNMFEAGMIEAVSICLPNSLHAPVSLAALEAGLHVLCEKPLAESAASGQEIVEAAARARSKFMICFNRRYRTDVQWMKHTIDAGRLGQIYQVKAGWIRETGIPFGWFADKEMAGGGPLIDLGVHMLDAVLWLLDYPQPLTVSGIVQTQFGGRGLKTWRQVKSGTPRDFSVEDSAVAFIRLENNVTLTLETSWASHAKPGQDDIFITLYGTEGTIELYIANYAAAETLSFYTEINGVPVTTRPAIKGVEHDHYYAVAEFVRCIREDVAPTATAEQGQTVMRIIDAIYRSARASREVVLA